MFHYDRGIRNAACHVKKRYVYSAYDAAIWMEDLMRAARDLNLEAAVRHENDENAGDFFSSHNC